ncbi:MAG: dihydroorotate dehydrogenase [Micromonosporaceae bacterium]
MPSLETRLGSIRLKNPVIAGSCEYTMTEAGIRACVDAGAGAVVAKSVNEDPAAAGQLDIAAYALVDEHHRRRPWAEASLRDSLLCRSGLAQDDLDSWLDMLARTDAYARANDSYVIGSITVARPEPAAAIAARMSEVVRCVELNLSAPHGREAEAVRQVTQPEGVHSYTSTVRAAYDGTLIVKITAQTQDVVALAEAATDAGADAVAMIGRFPGFMPDLDTGEPLLGSWAAIGGGWALPVSLYWVSKSHLTLGNTATLIGTNGARGGADVARFLLSGANAVELASAILTHGPAVLTAAVEECSQALDTLGIQSVTDAVGFSARRSHRYADIDPDEIPTTETYRGPRS